MKPLMLEEQPVVFYEAALNGQEPEFTYAQFEDGVSLTRSELKALTAKYRRVAETLIEQEF